MLMENIELLHQYAKLSIYLHESKKGEIIHVNKGA